MDFSILLQTHFNFICRRFRDKKENVEPEADPERDQRTVFAYQVDWFPPFLFVLNSINLYGLRYWYMWQFFCDDFLFALWCSQMPLKATERDVYEFFSKAGKVSCFNYDK